jgi:hypothetical protein
MAGRLGKNILGLSCQLATRASFSEAWEGRLYWASKAVDPVLVTCAARYLTMLGEEKPTRRSAADQEVRPT